MGYVCAAVLIEQGCMQKFCKGGGGGVRTCRILKRGGRSCKQCQGCLGTTTSSTAASYTPLLCDLSLHCYNRN